MGGLLKIIVFKLCFANRKNRRIVLSLFLPFLCHLKRYKGL
jgi:hypothetical protein